jgi:hypothetical protein
MLDRFDVPRVAFLFVCCFWILLEASVTIAIRVRFDKVVTCTIGARFERSTKNKHVNFILYVESNANRSRIAVVTDARLKPRQLTLFTLHHAQARPPTFEVLQDFCKSVV